MTLAALASAAATGPAPAAPTLARTITLGAFGGWLQAGLEQAVLVPFRKANPAWNVFVYPAATSLQLLNILAEQRLMPSMDLVLLDIAAARQASAANLLERISPDTMPVLKELSQAALPDGTAAPIMAWDSLAIGYNRALVRTPPASWLGLWNGAYARIAVQTPPDQAGLAFTQAASTAFGGHGDLDSLNVGLNALEALAPRVSLWNPRAGVITAVALGDAAIGPVWNGGAQAQAAKTPDRFGVILPGEGTPALPLTVGLVRNAPRTEGARALFAWILGREAQTAMTEAMALAPANASANPSPAALLRANATQDQVRRRMAIDWPVMTQIRDQLAAEWRRRNLGPQ